MSYNQSFKSASLSRPPHKWIDKSHSYSYTDHLARIVPTLVDRFAPGEKFELRETTNLWSSPFFAPIFSGISNKSRVFAVPLRKIVPHFEKWITSQINDQMLSIFTTVRDVAQSPFNEVVDNLFDKSLADFLGWPSLIRQWCIIMHGVDYEDTLANWAIIQERQETDFGSPLAELRAWSEQNSSLSPFAVFFASDPFADLSDSKNWSKRPDMDMRGFFDQRLSLVPFIAYQKVINDWLIDLRFQPDLFEAFFDYYENEYDDSNIHITATSLFTFEFEGESVQYNTLRFLMALRRIGYGKDYFTTAAAEAQRGEPLVIGPERLDLLFDVTQEQDVDHYPLLGGNELSATGTSGKVRLVAGRTQPSSSANSQALMGDVWAQVNESDQITPLKLRWQMALQRLLERENIAGYSRYTDFILGQYGIRVPDPYLLRSVYLGGYRTDINANPVVAQADGAADEENSSIIGEVAATGRGFNQGGLLRGRFAHDHCILLCLSWNIAETYYYQGFRTIFTDLKKIDMPLWEMAGVGEQPLYERELFFDQKPDALFGYQRRFSNHKIYHNEIHGEFRGNLQYFHTGRKFLQRPELGGDFLYQSGTDGHDRVFSVDPRMADPFRITKTYYYRHYMCV